MLIRPEGLDGIGASPADLVKDRFAAAQRRPEGPSLSRTDGGAKLAVKTSGAVRLRIRELGVGRYICYWRRMNNFEERSIRAVYDDTTIRVYQAYSDQIANSALANGTFQSPPFSMSRMTWIKPSFLWMMYRAGWGFKDDNQRRILAIDISREGFKWALAHSCPSHPPEGMADNEWRLLKANSPVRIQWDPERNLMLQPLAIRSIQIGIGGEAVELYVSSWVRKVTDVTQLAHNIHDLVETGQLDEAQGLLPQERLYEIA